MRFQWVAFIIAFIHLPQARGTTGNAGPWRRRLCDVTVGNVCKITSNRIISRPVVLRHSGSIKFSGARWQCVARAKSFESIRIDIAASGKISFVNGSLLHCATVALEASVVEVSDHSEVSANGTSFIAEPFVSGLGVEASSGLWSSEPQKGASHGGLGGTAGECGSDDAQLARRLGLVYGDPIAPWHFGRAAGTASGRGLGGGRIRIIAAESLLLNGTVSACGRGPEDAEAEGQAGAAAGSGGSIWISAGSIREPGAVPAAAVASHGVGEVDFVDELGAPEEAPGPRSGSVLALGGCCARCLCGGGGRVLMELAEGAPRHVIVAGGCWREAGRAGEECRCGSAGTWVLRRSSPAGKRRAPAKLKGGPRPWLPRWLRERQLMHIQHLPPVPGTKITVNVDNSHAVSLAGTKLSLPTPLSAFDTPVTLRLHDAVVVPTEEEPKWTLSGLDLLSDQTGSTLRHLHTKPFTLNFTQPNEGVELAFSSTLQAHELRVVGARHIVLRQNAAIDANIASLSAKEEIDMQQAALGQGAGAFDLYARRVVLGGGRLRMARVTVQEQLLVKSGSRLRSSHRRCDQLPAPCADPCERAFAHPLSAHGNLSHIDNVTFDIVLVAGGPNGSIIIEDAAELHAAAVLLCAAGKASIAGLVSARGLGCPPNRGQSAGATPESGESSLTARSRHSEQDRLRQGGNNQNKCSLCGGGGGAHSGNGGDGVQNRSRVPCEGTGGRKYDGWWSSETTGSAKPSRLPTWSASGGGGSAAGAGGGIVWVRSAVLDLPSNGTSLSASGEDAGSWADGSTEGAGGGAGGSIVLNASLIRGTGVVEAVGGRGGGCLGGGGGGGAIGSAGPEAAEAWAEFRGRLSVNGGGGDPAATCGKNVGQSGGEGELLQLGVCQPGEAGIFCAKCPPGTYNPPHGSLNATADYRICLPCTNKPSHGNYTASGWLNDSCPYACPGGFPPVEVNPNCDDPWTYYFAFFGGIWGVASFILVIAFLFGLSLSAAHLRRRRRLQWLRRQRQSGEQFRGLDDEALLLFESVRGRHPLADLDFTQRGAGVRRVASTQGLRGLLHPSHRWQRCAQRMLHPWAEPSSPRPRPRQEHMLRTGDLPYHTLRIYLLGENSPSDPWRLCRRPPEELSHLIDARRWDAFASQVNGLCTERLRSQSLAEGVLRWLYLPLAEYLRWRLRLARAAEVALFVWSSSEASRPDQTFWKLIRDNSSRFGLKFGTDWQMTLAFVDVLDYGKSPEDWVVKPQLPMVIAAAGDGEYTGPYHLDYYDPFVQSVAQYVGRRTWHQVLLAFNQFSRLLPPSPSEEDLRPLRRSMARISTRVLRYTDLECHAVIFQAPAPRPARSVAAGQNPMPSRQASWGTDSWEASSLPAHTFARLGSPCTSPPGSDTPVPGAVEVAWRQRLALVLTQRGSAEASFGHRSAVVHERRLKPTLHIRASGLVSPSEQSHFENESPAVGYASNPAASELWDMLAGGVSPDASDPFPPGMHSRALPSPPPSPPPAASGIPRELLGGAAPGRFWGSPRAAAGTRRRWASRRVLLPLLRDARRRLAAALHNGRNWREAAGRWFEDLLHFAAAPGNAIYGFYLRKLRDVRPLSGVGRQSGLYLRHRKPRGSEVTTLLCLILSLLVSVFCFIAESAVLFRLAPGHGAFFLALLWPPFANILALVFGVLFVCGAADGTTVCLFVVASNWNTALGFVNRVLAMDQIRSIGSLYVLAEYLISFSAKIAVCRLVNLTISYADAEPALLEPTGGEADHSWVKEHVLFRGPERSQAPRRREPALQPALQRASSMEEMVEAPSWFPGESNMPAFIETAGCGSGLGTEAARQLSEANDGSDGWTPLLRDHDPAQFA